MYRLFVIVLFCLSTPIFSQDITWSDLSQAYNLPKGVKLYKGTRTSPKLQAWVIDVDLNEKSIAVRPYLLGANTLPNHVKSTNSILAVNGGFFSGSTSLSTVIDLGVVKSKNVTSLVRNGANYPVVRSMFSLDKDFKPSIDWIYHFGDGIGDVFKFNAPLPYQSNDLMTQPVPNKGNGKLMPNLFLGIGGAPILVMDSIGSISYDQEIMWGSGVGFNNRDPRTAVGYTKDNHVILMVADGRTTTSDGMSLADVAQEMLRFKCVKAMNLDGGGSTGLADKTGYLSTPSEQRAIPTILSVVYRDSIPQEKRPTYEEVIDTENPKAKRTGAWSESANAGFYGDSRSLISARGNGSSEVSYSFTPPKNNICEVYAWWVAAPNRGKDTPYTIRHKGGKTTVRVDQSARGSQWNLLGKFAFAGDGKDTLKVSNDALAGDFVVADAMRLVSYGEMDAVSNSVELQKEDLLIYPNPVSDLVFIKGNLDELNQLIIRDQVGRKVSTSISQSDETWVVDMSSMNPGVYYLTALTRKGIISKKLLKL